MTRYTSPAEEMCYMCDVIYYITVLYVNLLSFDIRNCAAASSPHKIEVKMFLCILED